MKEFFNPFISGSDGSGGGGGEGGTVDAYTKAQTDAMLNKKANRADVYTKTETDDAITDQVSEIVKDISGLQKDSHTHSNKAILDSITQEQLDRIDTHNQPSSTITSMAGYSKPLSSSPILETDTLNNAIGKLEKAIEDKEVEGNYAGSSTNGGPATSAEKLSNTERIGTNKKPVYFSADGVPVAIDHTINSDVPENAKFTDTKYSAGTGIRVADDTMYNMGVLSVSESTTNGCIDITVGKNGTETSESKTIPVHGLGDAAYKSVDTVVTKDSANLITSGAVSAELDKKMDSSMRNSADGVAGLDGNSKINVSQIPTIDEYNVDSAYPVTGKAIEAAMNTLPNPMLYKGSLGTGGTITALPTASASNEGFTYKVITSGTYAGQSAKVGDVFISNGTEWTIIPSGDEPEGTVISVGMSVPTGLKIKDGTSPVTTSGTIEVQLDEGYIIPKTADIVPSTRKINNIALGSDVVLDGDDIKATGYAKAKSKSNITGTDTINQALGKLELKSDTNETNILTLKKHMVGELTDSDFQEDSTVAMTKTVPSGMSNYAAIKVIGGKTQKIVQLTSEKLASIYNVTLDNSSARQSNKIVYREGHVYMMSAVCNANGIRFQTDGKYGMAKIDDSKSTRLKKFTCTHADFSEAPYIYNTSSSASITGNFLIFDLTEMGIPTVTEAEFANMFPVYVPYGSYLWNAPVESVVSVGKNIFNFNEWYSAIKTATRGTIARVGDNGIKITATSNDSYPDSFGSVGLAIQLKSNTKYTLSWDSDSSKNGYIYVFKGNTSNYYAYAGNHVTKKITFTSDSTDTLIKVRFGTSTSGESITYSNIQLEEASDKTAYSPYNKTTLLVPSEARNCAGYGLGISDSVCNIADFENGVYTQMCDELDFDKLADSMYFNHSYSNHVVGIKVTGKASSVAVCSKYPYVTPPSSGIVNIPDKTFAMGSDGQMYIKDSAIAETTSPAQIKAVLAGAKAVYQLANPATKALTNFIRPLPVENGGTITLQNEHNLDMPNTVVYKKEVSLS